MIINVEAFKTDVIVFIDNLILMCDVTDNFHSQSRSSVDTDNMTL